MTTKDAPVGYGKNFDVVSSSRGTRVHPIFPRRVDRRRLRSQDPGIWVTSQSPTFDEVGQSFPRCHFYFERGLTDCSPSGTYRTQRGTSRRGLGRKTSGKGVRVESLGGTGYVLGRESTLFFPFFRLRLRGGPLTSVSVVQRVSGLSVHPLVQE